MFNLGVSEPTVFTLAEPSRPELFMLQRNTSCLRPASGAPVDLARPGAAKLLAERLSRWPAIQVLIYYTYTYKSVLRNYEIFYT